MVKNVVWDESYRAILRWCVYFDNAVRPVTVSAAVSRTTMERRTRRPRIFVKGEDDTSEFDINSLLSGDHIDEPTRKNLIDALGGFYFLAGGTKDPKMDLLLRAMQREEFEEGFLLINEVRSINPAWKRQYKVIWSYWLCDNGMKFNLLGRTRIETLHSG